MTKRLVNFTFCLLFIISGFLFLTSCIKIKEASFDGSLTIEYVDIDGNVKKSVVAEFKTGETWKELLERYFDNVTWDSNGTMVMTLEDYSTPADWTTYLSLKVNGEYSQVGITQVEIKDGITVSFVVTALSW